MNIINWKTCNGVSLSLIAGIELLNIKDMYDPDRMTTSLIVLMIGFGLTLATSVFLILSGLSTQRKKLALMGLPLKYAGKLLVAFLAKPFL